MPRRQDPIKKIVLRDKTVRWRFVIDVGRKVKTGPDGRPVLNARGEPVMVRDQRTHTFRTQKEAGDARAKMLADKSRGILVNASKKTVGQHLDEWLAGKRGIRESTLGNYRNALKPVYEQLGSIELQKLSKANVDALVTKMLSSGRRVGTKGPPLSPSTINLMLTVLGMALDDAAKQGLVVRNVARLVERPKNAQPEMLTWTAEQAGAFLASVADDRLAVGWQLSLYGLRRGEVLGLRWCDVDLVAKTLTIRKTRVIVDGQVVDGEPKTDRGKRTLPLDDAQVDALTALQLRQREEAETAGSAYGSCPDCGEGHVIVDELGDSVHPESYSDRFEVLTRKAGLPPIRLHDTLHTCGTLMHLRGVPTAVISAWLGHASASFTIKTYVHSQADALRDAGSTISARPTSRAPSKLRRDTSVRVRKREITRVGKRKAA
jgi:integrase